MLNNNILMMQNQQNQQNDQCDKIYIVTDNDDIIEEKQDSDLEVYLETPVETSLDDFLILDYDQLFSQQYNYIVIDSSVVSEVEVLTVFKKNKKIKKAENDKCVNPVKNKKQANDAQENDKLIVKNFLRFRHIFFKKCKAKLHSKAYLRFRKKFLQQNQEECALYNAARKRLAHSAKKNKY